MSFDWDEYRKLAEELRLKNDEASQRTAISRIYYAIYWRARTFLEKEGFIFRQYDSSHRQIWDEFKDRGRTFSGIGNSGDRLRRNRVEADYFSEIPNITALLERSFELAKNADFYLQQIEQKDGK